MDLNTHHGSRGFFFFFQSLRKALLAGCWKLRIHLKKKKNASWKITNRIILFFNHTRPPVTHRSKFSAFHGKIILFSAIYNLAFWLYCFPTFCLLLCFIGKSGVCENFVVLQLRWMTASSLEWSERIEFISPHWSLHEKIVKKKEEVARRPQESPGRMLRGPLSDMLRQV